VFYSLFTLEDPGFVLIEALASKTPVISSDCKNGPLEILRNGSAGYLYKSNNQDSFVSAFKKFYNDSNTNKKKVKKKIMNGLLVCKKYTELSHYNNLRKIF
jgi:glycosyltransferase involved in cell wall biosynthesis